MEGPWALSLCGSVWLCVWLCAGSVAVGACPDLHISRHDPFASKNPFARRTLLIHAPTHPPPGPAGPPDLPRPTARSWRRSCATSPTGTRSVEWNGMEWNGMEWNGMCTELRDEPNCDEILTCHIIMTDSPSAMTRRGSFRRRRPATKSRTFRRGDGGGLKYISGGGGMDLHGKH